MRHSASVSWKILCGEISSWNPFSKLFCMSVIVRYQSTTTGASSLVILNFTLHSTAMLSGRIRSTHARQRQKWQFWTNQYHVASFANNVSILLMYRLSFFYSVTFVIKGMFAAQLNWNRDEYMNSNDFMILQAVFSIRLSWWSHLLHDILI